MISVENIVQELAEFGVRANLIQQGNDQLGSDMAMPCFTLAKELKQSPQVIAQNIADKIDHPSVARAEAVAGYLNIWLSDDLLIASAQKSTEVTQSFKDQTVICEFFDTNPLKVIHVGHLYTGIVGSAIANLHQAMGANLVRLNYGGDVGLHVGMSMWAIIKALGGEDVAKLSAVPREEVQNWLSDKYAAGYAAYSSDETAKAEIIATNKRVYKVHASNDHESDFAQIYWTCRQLSYDYQKNLFNKIGKPFDRVIPESENSAMGTEIVLSHVADGVYTESNGAIVFKGEDYGLHTRVFINSEGLPTYEAKDVGLIHRKWQDYKYDLSIVITDKSQGEYFKVMLKSVEQYNPEPVQKMKHITHGQIKLAGGVKMSSRLGNILVAEDVIHQAHMAANEQSGVDNPEDVYMAAIKYAFLRPTVGQDIVYDPKESVSTHGNSGPYLQYAHARACSILAKTSNAAVAPVDLTPEERVLVQKIGRYSNAVAEATEALSPSKLCTYLYELTTAFNKFYEVARIIDDPREPQRLAILGWYKESLAAGLQILGITAITRM